MNSAAADLTDSRPHEDEPPVEVCYMENGCVCVWKMRRCDVTELMLFVDVKH